MNVFILNFVPGLIRIPRVSLVCEYLIQGFVF